MISVYLLLDCFPTDFTDTHRFFVSLQHELDRQDTTGEDLLGDSSGFDCCRLFARVSFTGAGSGTGGTEQDGGVGRSYALSQ